MSTGTADVKACCASAYASEAARFLLGDQLHPGGAALTDELARLLGVGPGGVVVDVGAGPGTSARRLATLTGCSVLAVDVSATDGAQSDGVRFIRGDAEALPLGDASVDGALCECAFCLFPDKPRAARELARVLRPGARLALSDVWVDPQRVPEDLRALDAHVACLAGALPLDDTAELLASSGLAVERIERRDALLTPLLDRVAARLRFARLLGGGPLASVIDRGDALVGAARTALRDGAIGYGVIVARR